MGGILEAEKAAQRRSELVAVWCRALKQIDGALVVIASMVPAQTHTADGVGGGDAGEDGKSGGDVGEAVAGFVVRKLGRLQVGLAVRRRALASVTPHGADR